jgi:succinate dehydrogenase / fumarate reductase cytochrome b subunit
MASNKIDLKSFPSSPIGRKILTGITGLGLTVFVLVHMFGNLTFFSPDEQAYNAYAHKLISLGPLLWAIEIGLLAFFVVHIVLGVKIYVGKKAARPVDYAEYKSVGGPSKQSAASRTMIVTGVILGLFLVFHLLSFKYGPSIDDGYVTMLHGEEARDLRRLMVEKFQQPLYAFGYPLVMLLLGFHLRHGVWSALQSLGAMKPSWSPFFYSLAAVIGALIAVGFLVLPLWVYFGGGA